MTFFFCIKRRKSPKKKTFKISCFLNSLGFIDYISRTPKLGVLTPQTMGYSFLYPFRQKLRKNESRGERPLELPTKGGIMIEFLPLRADIENDSFENIQYLPFVIDLLFENKQLIIDDYFPQEDGELLDYIVEEITSLYPWFVVGLLDGEPLGTAWLTHWHYPHSCQLHACIDRKFWGKTSLYAMEELLKFLHQTTGIKRVQMEIPEFNKIAINYAKKTGFQEEGLIKCATLKGGKCLNHVLFGKILC